MNKVISNRFLLQRHYLRDIMANRRKELAEMEGLSVSKFGSMASSTTEVKDMKRGSDFQTARLSSQMHIDTPRAFESNIIDQ